MTGRIPLALVSRRQSQFGHHFFNIHALGNNILQNIGIAVVNTVHRKNKNLIKCQYSVDISNRHFGFDDTVPAHNVLRIGQKGFSLGILKWLEKTCRSHQTSPFRNAQVNCGARVSFSFLLSKHKSRKNMLKRSLI